MAIPKDILNVERPSNTIVKITRNPNIYSVVKRTSKRIEGKKNPVPIEIGVIGKIINGIYVPLPPKAEYDTDFKIYGDSALYDSTCKEIFKDLLQYYEYEDATKIYCIALLRALHSDLTNEDIQFEYKTNFISEFYPNVSLSPNTISAFLEKIGMKLNTIDGFMNERIRKYSGHSTVIDGMLKNNCSETNIYSEFSRKGRVKGIEDINLIYAYDLSIKEPIACSVFPGNMLDFTSFRTFIEDHPISNGFMIMDKGFNDEISKEKLKELNTIYLIPVKTSSKLISKLELDKTYTNHFKFENDTIRCKKIMSDDGKYYYAYKSTDMKNNQDKGYITRNLDKGTYKEETYERKESRFGLIVFESNGDLDLKDVYLAYKTRWEIEILFNNYKNIVNRQEVNVQGNYRLFATEFINFISSIMSMKVKNLLIAKELTDTYTQKQVIRLLSKYAKRRSTKNPEKWVPCARLKYVEELCKKLDV